MKSAKSSKRIKIVDEITKTLTDPKIYKTINYERQSEDKIKQFLYQPLLRTVRDLHVELNGISKEYSLKKAEKELLWEGNKQTTVSHLKLFGMNHRPDMILNFDNTNIAIEFKKGGSGSSIREGIGQSMVYTSKYDFVIYILFDTTKEKRIKESLSAPLETEFLQMLWDDFNIMFKVTH